MNSQVLKPCPFCSGSARLDQRETESLWSHNDATFSHVSCEDCEIEGRDFCDDPNGEEAIEWWNTRATPAPIPDAGEGVDWQQLCAEAQVQRDDYQAQRDQQALRADVAVADANDAERKVIQQAQRIGELDGLLLDTGAERNSMQRERDAYKLLLDRECNDADSIFMALGIEPDSIRTEGGFLMVAHLVSLISAGSERLSSLMREAIPGLQHLSDTAQDLETFTLVARVKSALAAGKDGS